MLKDAGEEKPIMTPDGKLETEVEYQELEFNDEMLPEIGGWEVGEEYDLIVHVKMKELSTELEDDEKCVEAEFDVLAVGAYKPPQSAAEKIARTKLGLN